MKSQMARSSFLNISVKFVSLTHFLLYYLRDEKWHSSCTNFYFHASYFIPIIFSFTILPSDHKLLKKLIIVCMLSLTHSPSSRHGRCSMSDGDRREIIQGEGASESK